jgi:hypothetical protein
LNDRPQTRASQRITEIQSTRSFGEEEREQPLTEDEIIYLTRRRAALMNPDEYREAANHIIANHYERLRFNDDERNSDN